MTTEINPIWSRFCAIQLETWLEWLRNIHLRSYFDLGDRFIMLNPYYYPSAEDQEALPIFNRLMINEDFIGSLSDKGILVWANSGFQDFVEALRPYGNRYSEIAQIITYFETHLQWFRRVYQFLRSEMIMKLREEGRSI